MDLRTARKKRQMTQEQLEAKAGVDQSVISRLERGATSPEWTTVERLETALKLRPGTLDFSANRPRATESVAS